MEKIKNFFSKHKGASNTATVVAGLIVGIANGLFGGGGGMLAVPAFTTFKNIEQKKAHATALLSILPLCIISSVIYILNGNFDSEFAYYVIGGVVAGGVIGSFVLKNINSQFLSFLFYILMLVAGIRMVIK